MRPLEVLLADDSAGVFELQPWVERLARRHADDLSTEDLEDLVMDVLFKLYDTPVGSRILERNPGLDPGSDAAERIVTAYVRRMLANAVTDRSRKHRRETTRLEDAPEPTVEPEQGLDRDAQAVLQLARDDLAEAMDAVAKHRKVDWDGFEAAVQQIQRLARGACTMHELVDEALQHEPDTPRKTLYGRLQRRHSRARAYLRDAVALLEPEAAERLSTYLDVVLTRRRKRPLSEDDRSGRPPSGGTS